MEAQVQKRKKMDTAYRFKDVTKLTPHQEKLWELKKQGLSPKEIASALGVKSYASLGGQLKVLNEKLECSGLLKGE